MAKQKPEQTSVKPFTENISPVSSTNESTDKFDHLAIPRSTQETQETQTQETQTQDTQTQVSQGAESGADQPNSTTEVAINSPSKDSTDTPEGGCQNSAEEIERRNNRQESNSGNTGRPQYEKPTLKVR